MVESIPNSKNFCGGNFQDWLEVNLIETCNAKCSWCIERDGYHPAYHAPIDILISQILASGKTNIVLLGGEPLLYKGMSLLVNLLVKNKRKVWITTNGFLLTTKYIFHNLYGITGVNISIHHYDMEKNKEITHIRIKEDQLISAIRTLHYIGAHVRMNCNSIAGYIDTPEEIINYVHWAKNIGADKVRFAELKQDDDGFVDLARVLNYKYGLNDNPFTHGCNSDCVIEGIPVNFRQMCGLQTSRRIAPINPKQVLKQVLYYDGKMYNGWQTSTNKEDEMIKNKKPKETLSEVINTLTNSKLTKTELEALVHLFRNAISYEVTQELSHREVHHTSSGGCQY